MSSLVLVLKVTNLLEWAIFWKWTFEQLVCSSRRFIYIYMKETRHLLLCSFIFPLRSSYLYSRISSWTAKMSSCSNIQLNFSSELQKWTNDNMFPLQDTWKLIITLVNCANHNNEQWKKPMRKSRLLSSKWAYNSMKWTRHGFTR